MGETMAGWIFQAARRGILTTRYPDELPTPEEAPALAHAPMAPSGRTVDLEPAEKICPTSAIGREGVRQGACIRCGRCTAAGLAMSGPVDLVARTREGLTWKDGHPPGAAEDPIHPRDAAFSRSLHVFLVDIGSCNGCNLECSAIANPFYDSQRLGIFFTNSPRHADLLLVVGVPTPELVGPVRSAYDAMPAPKAVVAVGACAIDGGIFAGRTGLPGPLDSILPVDVYVPGCPPPPIAILRGLLEARNRLGSIGGSQ
jgi:Ni,Fe-hydrogenase III small subunit